jgi:subfamily B ATP-binding cassette protein MsbA
MTVTTGERGSAATEGARVRPSRWARLTRILHDGSLALIGRLLNETGREFARRYAIVLLLGVIVAATTALNAWVIKDVVNKIFVERRVDMLYLLSGIVVANGFVRGWALYASSVTLGRIGNAIVARTQRRMFDHLLSMGVDFFNRTASSDLVTRMSHNAAAARQVLDTLFTTTGRDLSCSRSRR